MGTNTKQIAMHAPRWTNGKRPADGVDMAAACVLARQPFKAAGMSGRWATRWADVQSGEIYRFEPRAKENADDVYAANSDFIQLVRRWAERGGAYVVYSYDTPIAAMSLGGRIAEARGKFSPTTSKHQGKAAQILSAAKAKALADHGIDLADLAEFGEFANLDEIRAANKALGHEFFDGSHAKRVGARSGSNVFGGCVFVESGRYEYGSERRLWRVYVANVFGDVTRWKPAPIVSSVTDPIEYEFCTAAAANRYAKDLGEKIAALRATRLAALGVSA